MAYLSSISSAFAGGNMDHPGNIPMNVNEFGGLTPDSSFLNQPGGPGGGGGPGPEHMMGVGPGGGGAGGGGGPIGGGAVGSGGSGGNGGPRGGSPEFMGAGNFSEPQNMQNEGMVW